MKKTTWNKGKAYGYFLSQQRKREKQYRANGMTEEQIAAINTYDREQFNRERRFFEHEQSIDIYYDESDDAPDKGEYAEYFSIADKPSESSLLWWIDEIENPEILSAIQKLTRDELYTIPLYAFYHYKISEIATMIGVYPSTVSRRINKLKQLLTK